MKKIKLTISDYGYSGEGVAKYNGKVCFLPYTILGEQIEAEVLSEQSKFLKCRPVKILQASSKRENAPCPYFSVCGGCNFQHISYEEELQLKKLLIKRQLEKIGYGGQICIHKSKNQYFYRNKIKLFCLGDRLALYQEGSKKLVPIDRCLLVKNEINETIEKIQTFISAKNIGSKIENIYIRYQGGQTLVNFLLKHRCEIEYAGLQLMLGANAGIFQTVKETLPEHVSGISELHVQEFGLDCRFGVNAFHQVNDDVAKELYENVIALAQGDTIINAYSGAGVLSGILATNKRRVYGIEIGQAEHQAAEKLKEDNNLKNLFNIKGDCADCLGKCLSSDVQTIVLDPPRAGINENVAKTLNESNVNNLIYISCNIATLTRDITRLDNYEICQIHLFDMFSRTSSMEILCQLRLKA